MDSIKRQYNKFNYLATINYDRSLSDTLYIYLALILPGISNKIEYPYSELKIIST